jgi:hypothetical protein
MSDASIKKNIRLVADKQTRASVVLFLITGRGKIATFFRKKKHNPLLALFFIFRKIFSAIGAFPQPTPNRPPPTHAYDHGKQTDAHGPVD